MYLHGSLAIFAGSVHIFPFLNIGYVFQVITTDAMVASDVWRKMVQIAVNRSFNQITVRNFIL
jgi:glutamate N-acetyltransferase/amino-acid N-acetyltransferase